MKIEYVALLEPCVRHKERVMNLPPVLNEDGGVSTQAVLYAVGFALLLGVTYPIWSPFFDQTNRTRHTKKHR